MEQTKYLLRKSWDTYFKKLQAFKKKHGHCDVPFEWEKDPELAYWTEVQRRSKAVLPPPHFKQLKNLGFNWRFEDLSWDAMFKRLRNYHKKHFHAVIHRNDAEHHKLWRWLTTQKSSRGLSKHKKELLQQFLEGVDITTLRELRWEERFAELQAFKKQHGHCRVPQGYKPNPQLAQWVVNIKNRPQHQNRDRIARLKKEGFQFGRWEPTWEEMYARLVAFKKEYGHTSPSLLFKADPALGPWVVLQRVLNTRRKLLKPRKAMLNKIEFDWHPLHSRWLKKFSAYKNLYVKYKGRIPYHLVKEGGHENWLYAQRKYFEENKLSKAQIRLLKSVRIDLHRKPTTSWDDRFEELKKFKKTHGHFRLFKKDLKKENGKLAAWVDMQRKRKKQKLLAKSRVMKMNSIGFPWDGTKAYAGKGMPRARKKHWFS